MLSGCSGLNGVLKRCVHPESANVTLMGKRVAADVIELRLSRCDHPGLGEGGKPNDKCPYSRRDPQGRQPCGDGGRD